MPNQKLKDIYKKYTKILKIGVKHMLFKMQIILSLTKEITKLNQYEIQLKKNHTFIKKQLLC